MGTKLETSVLDDAFDRHDNDPAPPTEVALLLDQALDGDLLMHAQSARSRPEDVAEEGYPAEFINAVFSQ